MKGKRFLGSVSLLIVCMMIAGSLAACSGGDDTPQQSNQSPAGQSSNAAQTQAPSGSGTANTALPAADQLTPEALSRTIPVVMIRSKDPDNQDLRFIEEPVAKIVSDSISSWDPEYVAPPEPYYVKCDITVLDEGGKGKLESVDAKVKVRGNWTTNVPKKSLRIRFDEKHKMLGLHDGKKYTDWILLAEYKDISMLRDRTALQISREILGADGLYASDSKLVAVFVNDVYRGVYLLVEQQEVKGGRIKVGKVDKDYEGTDIGYFLELDGYYYGEDPLRQFHVGYADNAPLKAYNGGGEERWMLCLPDWERHPDDNKADIGFTIKSDINCEEQRDFIANYVENVYRIMYEAAYNNKAYVFTSDYSSIKTSKKITPWDAVSKVVNVDSLADMYIISDLTCDADLYWSSFYMSADFSEGGDTRLTFQAPWDFDSAMGIKQRCIDGTGFYAGNIMPDVNGYTAYGKNFDTINPWLAVLAYMDEFQKIVSEKWTKAYDAGVFERAYATIESDTRQYGKELERNVDRWSIVFEENSYVSELSPQAYECKTQKEAAAYLLSWLKSRVKFLDGQYRK